MCTRELIERIREWIEKNGVRPYAPHGAYAKTLYDEVGVSATTWYKWVKKPGVEAAVKAACEVFEHSLKQRGVNALLKSVEGYYAEETKTERMPDASGKPVIVKQITHKKYIAPSPIAQIFFLKNIDPEHWRDKVENDINVSGAKTEFKVIVENPKEDGGDT